MTPDLSVLFEDNHCLAVAKPAPLLTQGVPAGVPTLEAMVKAYLKDRYTQAGQRLPRHPAPARPARLRRGGVRAQHQGGRAGWPSSSRAAGAKVYWAVVEPNADGALPPEEGVWEDWLLKIQDEARTERVAGGDAGREAGGAALSPAVGDGGRGPAGDRAGDGPDAPDPRAGGDARLAGARRRPVRGRLPFGPPAELPRDRIIALHARCLTFLHPIRYEPMTVTAPLPEAWRLWAPGLPATETTISP